MSKPLQIGIIGLGYWEPNLVRNFRAVEGAAVRICCDLDLSRFQKLTAQYGDLDFTTSAKEVIEHPEVDAVAIATPVHTHFELARMALNAGKSVLVEKPLSLRVEDAEELVEPRGPQGSDPPGRPRLRLQSGGEANQADCRFRSSGPIVFY